MFHFVLLDDYRTYGAHAASKQHGVPRYLPRSMDLANYPSALGTPGMELGAPGSRGRAAASLDLRALSRAGLIASRQPISVQPAPEQMEGRAACRHRTCQDGVAKGAERHIHRMLPGQSRQPWRVPGLARVSAPAAMGLRALSRGGCSELSLGGGSIPRPDGLEPPLSRSAAPFDVGARWERCPACSRSTGWESTGTCKLENRNLLPGQESPRGDGRLCSPPP